MQWQSLQGLESRIMSVAITDIGWNIEAYIVLNSLVIGTESRELHYELIL